MLGIEDRAAIMAGLEAGLSQVCVAHLIGRSPSVVCREIARHTDPDGEHRAEETGKAACASRRRPKKRLLDCDEVLRRRVISDLSQGHTPRRISAPLARRSVWHTALHGHSLPRRSQGADSRGGCNACYALSSSSSRCLGVSQFSVLRGRSLSWSAMASRSASVRSDRSVPLGMYWRNSPFVFSLVPRCQGECGSQKYTSRPSSEAILRC